MVEEAQKHKAKRIFEILWKKELLFKDFHSQYPDLVYIIPLSSDDDFVQALAEAIAQAEGEVWEELNRDGRHEKTNQ